MHRKRLLRFLVVKPETNSEGTSLRRKARARRKKGVFV